MYAKTIICCLLCAFVATEVSASETALDFIKLLDPILYDTLSQMSKDNKLVNPSMEELKVLADTSEFKEVYTKNLKKFCDDSGNAKNFACVDHTTK